MKVKIKPIKELFGKGTKKDAISHFKNCFRCCCFTYSSDFGSYYTKIGENDTAIFYTMQVFKRGKYRKEPHYAMKVYKVPYSVLKYFNLKVIPSKVGFRLVNNK